MATIIIDRRKLSGILSRIWRSIGDINPIMRSIKANRFQKIQWEHARNSWGGASQNAESTIAARSKKRGYYKRRARKGVGARSPVFVWTGRFNDATARFTTLSKKEASIDVIANYKGSDSERIPHMIDALEARGGALWDIDALNRELARSIDGRIRSVTGRLG